MSPEQGEVRNLSPKPFETFLNTATTQIREVALAIGGKKLLRETEAGFVTKDFSEDEVIQTFWVAAHLGKEYPDSEAVKALSHTMWEGLSDEEYDELVAHINSAQKHRIEVKWPEPKKYSRRDSWRDFLIGASSVLDIAGQGTMRALDRGVRFERRVHRKTTIQTTQLQIPIPPRPNRQTQA